MGWGLGICPNPQFPSFNIKLIILYFNIFKKNKGKNCIHKPIKKK